jgi:hypothetical protein
VIAKWEYTIGKCDQADLNEKGNEGWEMVGAAEVKRGIACCCKVFIRDRKDRVQIRLCGLMMIQSGSIKIIEAGLAHCVKEPWGSHGLEGYGLGQSYRFGVSV